MASGADYGLSGAPSRRPAGAAGHLGTTHTAPAPPPATVFARGGSHENRAVYGALRFGLYHQARAEGGRALGPDFVMHLGGEGLTPDLLYLRPDHASRLHSYHVEGPADLVVEITGAARRNLDLGARRHRYERGGVPEYWVVDPASKTVYACRPADTVTAVTHGTVEAGAAGGGLRLDLSALWTATWGRPLDPFLARTVKDDPGHPGTASPAAPISGEPGWDALPFAPAPGLDPVPIPFDQYLAWCPESKFERLDGCLTIASDEGTRRVMALLMMTLGLREIVPCLPLLAWVVFLNPGHYLPAIEADRTRLLAQARLAASDVGPTHYWVGDIPTLPVRAVARHTGRVPHRPHA